MHLSNPRRNIQQQQHAHSYDTLHYNVYINIYELERKKTHARVRGAAAYCIYYYGGGLMDSF